jgi:hypothetical protein
MTLLESLNLADTEVGDGTLGHLSRLTSIKRLQLAYTKVQETMDKSRAVHEDVACLPVVVN